MAEENRPLPVVLLLLFGLAMAAYSLSLAVFDASRISQLVYFAFSAIPLAGAFWAARAYGFYGKQGEVFGLLLFAFFFFFAGELIWTVLAWRHLDVFPSEADFFYLLFYPLLFWAELKELAILRFSLLSSRRKTSFPVILSALGLSFLVGYFGIYLAFDSEASFLNNAVVIGYGLGDLILIFLAFPMLRMAWEFRGGQIFSSWLAFAVGLLLTLFADIGFAIFNEAYEQGSLAALICLDALWMASFGFFGYAFFGLAGVVERAQKRIESH